MRANGDAYEELIFRLWEVAAKPVWVARDYLRAGNMEAALSCLEEVGNRYDDWMAVAQATLGYPPQWRRGWTLQQEKA